MLYLQVFVNKKSYGDCQLLNRILPCIIFCQTFVCADLFEAVCAENTVKVEALIHAGAKVNAHMQTPLLLF